MAKKNKNKSSFSQPNGTVPRVFGSYGLGVETTGVPTDLEVLAKLEPPTGLKEYYKMQVNDPIIGGIMWQIESLFGRCEMHWDGDVPAAIKEILSGTFWRKILLETSSTLTYGFYVGEEIWQIIDGLPMLIDIEPRFQPTIQKFVDGEISQCGATDSAEMPQSKCLHITIGAQARSPFGTSFLHSVYKPYYMKTNIEASEANALDRDLSGLPDMQAPEGFDFMKADPDSAIYDVNIAETLTWAINIVQNIRKDTQQGIVRPYGWELKLLRAEGDARDTSEPIRRYNNAICMGLLESFLAPIVDVRGRGSDGELHVSLFTSAINAFIRRFVEEINSQVVSKLQRIYAFKGQLVASPVTNYNLRDLASYIGRLVSQGAIDPTDVLKKSILGIIDIPYEKEG